MSKSILNFLQLKPDNSLIDFLVDSIYTNNISIDVDGSTVAINICKQEFKTLFELSLFLLNEKHNNAVFRNVFFIGISGNPGSGKSFLSNLLSYFFSTLFNINTITLSTDAYIYDNDFLDNIKKINIKGCIETIDLQALYNDLYSIKYDNSSIYLPIYSRITHNKINNKLRFSPNNNNIVIVEGLFLFTKQCKNVCNLLDYKIFLNTSIDVCYNRILNRKLNNDIDINEIRKKFETVDKVNIKLINDDIKYNLLLQFQPDKYVISEYKIPEEDTDDNSLLFNLFSTTKLVSSYFNFSNNNNHKNIHYLISESNSTDYDLTGLLVWSASILLGCYFLSINEDLINNTKSFRTLELGAGSGIVSLLLSNILSNSEIYITDHNPQILMLLYYNTLYNKAKNNAKVNNKIFVNNLDFVSNKNNSLSTIKSFDIIFGADIIYDCNVIEPCISFVVSLLTKKDSKFILSYINRYSIVTSKLKEKLNSAFKIVVDVQNLDNILSQEMIVKNKIPFQLSDMFLFICSQPK